MVKMLRELVELAVHKLKAVPMELPMELRLSKPLTASLSVLRQSQSSQVWEERELEHRCTAAAVEVADSSAEVAVVVTKTLAAPMVVAVVAARHTLTQC
jgi:hypothetical protein